MATEVKWLAEDRVIEKLREYSRKKTGSSKALSGTINQNTGSNKRIQRHVFGVCC